MKILLVDWAAAQYNPPPSAYVLRSWRLAGQIVPAPEKVGSAYYVDESARRQLKPRPTLVQRLKAAEHA